jgi:hypothetical protein
MPLGRGGFERPTLLEIIQRFSRIQTAANWSNDLIELRGPAR